MNIVRKLFFLFFVASITVEFATLYTSQTYAQNSQQCKLSTDSTEIRQGDEFNIDVKNLRFGSQNVTLTINGTVVDSFSNNGGGGTRDDYTYKVTKSQSQAISTGDAQIQLSGTRDMNGVKSTYDCSTTIKVQTNPSVDPNPSPGGDPEKSEFCTEFICFIGLDENGNPYTGSNPSLPLLPGTIDENTTTVKAVISGVESGRTYKIDIAHPDAKDSKEIEQKATGDTITLYLCGDGTTDVLGFQQSQVTKMKLANSSKNKDKKQNPACGTDDYFEAKEYGITVVDKDSSGTYKEEGRFFVKHNYPEFTSGPTANGNSITFGLKSVRKPQDTEHRNNYQIVFGRDGGDEADKCFFLTNNENNKNEDGIKFSVNNHVLTWIKEGLAPGNYRIKINEMVNDRGFQQSFLGLRGSCSGGFTYWEIDCTIGKKDKNGTMNSSCSKPKGDPNRSDINQAQDVISSLNKKPDEWNIPCADGTSASESASGSCDAIKTAFGTINVQPKDFVKQLFTILLSVSALIATFTFVLNGYKLLTSAGDKQKIADAREKITSSIIGILFIIFAFVILEFIVNDILRIPGFG